MKIRKAVLPVAGLGTRFLPVTKVVPKELLPIVNKPVIQYLVEEAVHSGITDVILVISREKELLRDYFSPAPALEKLLQGKGKRALYQSLERLHSMARFHFVYQEKPLGDGHALLCAEKAVDGEPFLVLFGDDVVKSRVPAALQMMNHFRDEAMIAVEPIPRHKTHFYGIVAPRTQKGRLYEVADMVEKPSPAKAPSTLGIIGKYVCPPALFEALRRARPGRDGEIRLIDGLLELKKTQRVWAYEVAGERFDTGRPEGLIAANNAFLV